MKTTAINTQPAIELRANNRFPIECDVRYKTALGRYADHIGSGKTINMSSSGVLFTAEGLLSPGARLELCISWPVRLDGKCALQLVAKGRVVRSGRHFAAVHIYQHEFRTLRLSSAIAPSDKDAGKWIAMYPLQP
jgi:PilZ domain